MSKNPLGCLIVEAGATADVEGCYLEGSAAGPGSRVNGKGSFASLSGCVLTGGITCYGVVRVLCMIGSDEAISPMHWITTKVSRWYSRPHIP